jgi:hypothetical protein
LWETGKLSEKTTRIDISKNSVKLQEFRISKNGSILAYPEFL